MSEKRKKAIIEALADIYGKFLLLFFVVVLFIKREMPYLRVKWDLYSD
jgi:hypothetical protein